MNYDPKDTPQNERPSIDKILPRVKYYLLEWKDENLERYRELFGEVGLKDLTNSQLVELFRVASRDDQKEIDKKGR